MNDPFKSIKEQLNIVNQTTSLDIINQFKAIGDISSTLNKFSIGHTYIKDFAKTNELMRNAFGSLAQRNHLKIPSNLIGNIAAINLPSIAENPLLKNFFQQQTNPFGNLNIGKVIGGVNIGNHAAFVESLSAAKIFKNQFDSFSKDSFRVPTGLNKTFGNPDISEIIKVISENKTLWETFQSIRTSVTEDLNVDAHIKASLEKYLIEFEDSKDKVKLLENSAKTSNWLLYILIVSLLAFLSFCNDVAKEVAVGLVSDEIKPYVKQFLSSNPLTTNKQISSLSSSHQDIDFQHIRFVRVNGLQVRMTPNFKGKLLDILSRGDVIVLVQKDESLSWSLIEYKNDDGQLIQGWVFSRYLQKFNKIYSTN